MIAMSVSAAAIGQPQATVCQRLAEPAEHLPLADWTAGIYDPVDGLINGRSLRRSEVKLTPLEEKLIGDPAWRKDFGIAPDAPLGIEHLNGTDVYRIDAFQGSANCQDMIFLEAPPGGEVHRLPAPFSAQPCATQYGRFGTAFGKPVFLVGGDVAMTGLDRSYKISAWKGQREGWGPACELILQFQQALKVTGTYCSPDSIVCEAAAALAPSVVAAYGRSAQVDPLVFAGGGQPPEALMKALNDTHGEQLQFPTFGSQALGAKYPFQTSFTSARTPARVALWINGQWWLGVVDNAGIGWRESTTVLLIVYDVTGTGLSPAASFQVEKVPAGTPQAHWR